MNLLRIPLLASLLLTACAVDADPGDDLAETGQELGSLKVTITSGPASPTNQANATFTYRASSSGASFFCRVDGMPYVPCSPPGITYHVADGAHQFQVYARRGGQTSAPATWSWIVDTTAPAVTITSAPPAVTNAAAATFTFVASDPGATLQCQLDGGPFVPCISPFTVTVTNGAHTFVVRAVDSAGNVSAATWSWIVDTTAPAVTITSAPPAVTSAAAATFTFVASDPGATLQCQVDSGPFVACTSPFTVTVANGAHTFSVRAVDSAGNVSALASVTWTVDTTAPALVITSAPPNPSSSTNATFTFATSEPAVTACSLDGNAFFACASPVSYVNLAAGVHQLVIRATDTAGNVSSVSYVWSIL